MLLYGKVYDDDDETLFLKTLKWVLKNIHIAYNMIVNLYKNKTTVHTVERNEREDDEGRGGRTP